MPTPSAVGSDEENQSTSRDPCDRTKSQLTAKYIRPIGFKLTYFNDYVIKTIQFKQKNLCNVRLLLF